MKVFNKILAAATVLGVGTAMLFSFGGVASADCWQYTGDTMSTSKTPVFNNICNVPYGIGDENDFVRIRTSNGNDTAPTTGTDYTSTLNAACKDGDQFDVRTYIHNDAEPGSNNNGTGSAVAHNVQLAMQAKGLNTTGTSFPFSSTVSASNAASVSDSATLNCGNGQVKLTLVPGTVKVYSKAYSWQGMNDSAVNGTSKVGSDSVGSGTQWGCWDYRIVVVYEVKVQKVVTPPPVTAKCDLFTVTAEDRKVTVNKFNFTATNATVKNLVVNWGDSKSNTYTDMTKVKGQTHSYANYGTYVITAVMNFTSSQGNITSKEASCAQQVTFKPNQPPVVVVPPTTTPPATTTVTSLPNTGAGSAAGMFAAVTAAGAAGYRYFLGRRLSRS